MLQNIAEFSPSLVSIFFLYSYWKKVIIWDQLKPGFMCCFINNFIFCFYFRHNFKCYLVGQIHFVFQFSQILLTMFSKFTNSVLKPMLLGNKWWNLIMLSILFYFTLFHASCWLYYKTVQIFQFIHCYKSLDDVFSGYKWRLFGHRQ